MSSDKFGDYLIDQGLLRRDDVLKALELQADATVKVGTICLEEGYMTMKQVMSTLRDRADTGRQFEDIAISFGFLTSQQLGQILKIQGQRRPFFGELLIKMELIDRQQLFEQLALFWQHNNEKRKQQELASGNTPPPRKMLEKKEIQPIQVPFPLMYPEELREFIEDIEHSLQQIVLELAHIRPGADIPAVTGQIAFYANKIRGAADLDDIGWLSAVAEEMEKGMLVIAEDTNFDRISDVVHAYFHAVDCIHAFIDSIEGNSAQGDKTIVEEIEEAMHAYGQLEDLVSRDKIGKEMAGKKKANTRKVTKLEGMHVLLIDDDTVIRNTLERYLRSFKMDVEQAKNGAIGLERLLQSQRSFDLVIVDLHMPIMDGFEFVTEVRKKEEYDDLPIVMFTASLHMADVRKAINLGINGYVMKREWKQCLFGEIARILGLPEDALIIHD